MCTDENLDCKWVFHAVASGQYAVLCVAQSDRPCRADRPAALSSSRYVALFVYYVAVFVKYVALFVKYVALFVNYVAVLDNVALFTD